MPICEIKNKKILEIKKPFGPFEKSNGQILEIKTKNHLRNQMDKFWKSKNHLYQDML